MIWLNDWQLSGKKVELITIDDKIVQANTFTPVNDLMLK